MKSEFKLGDMVFSVEPQENFVRFSVVYDGKKEDLFVASYDSIAGAAADTLSIANLAIVYAASLTNGPIVSSKEVN